MNIVLTSHACNHLLRLAQGLQNEGALARLYTIYPYFKLKPYQLHKESIHSVKAIAAAIYLARKSGVGFPDAWLTKLFELYVTNILRVNHDLRSANLLQGNSGYCLSALQLAKSQGVKAVVDRACPHINFQLSILDEEVERLTGKSKQISSKHTLVDKMLAEYEEADGIIVPSSYSYNSFVEAGVNPEKLYRVPLIKEKAVTPGPSNQEKSNTFTVLAVGFSFYRKGFYYLLKAWHELNLPNAKLILRNVVPEPFRHLLKHDSIEAIDHHLSIPQLIEFYRACDVFCLPSIDEGFGMVALEAMAAEKPIIITENVGMHDIIEDGREGFVLPIRDIDAIKVSLLKLYEDRELAHEMGKAGAACEARYSLDRYVQSMMSTYQHIIEA